MTQLLTHYSISEILLFIVILAIAIKKFVEFIDWYKKRTSQAVHEADKPVELEETIDKHEQQLSEIKSQLSDIKNSINLLIQSDKDDIKQSITKQHHYFCYKIGSIDDYSLDCLEKRFSHYKDEGGNSFVKTLMDQVRMLPRKLDVDKM